ncbi:MAG: 5-formyltetrahydrofolate cyclo-ligase [Alphaproteobacteria bacterium RIFCSPHIGHO2_12_FULL_66_14]|nr:MAG: 5-formyltetrahydrofolate cyclo-ligase [Alphaproteobacteria bacterium RIFCSPHIGHO2_12_FULL_66_14]
MTLTDEKRALRSAMLAWRGTLDEEERRAAATDLLATLRRERPIETPVVVSGFWPIKDEIDIRPLMMELFNEGCQMALPVVQGRGLPLLFRAWRPGDPLEAGVFGTLQPAARRETVEPDSLLVPLLACDNEGWRLGYGGGFYDRTLLGLRSRRKVTAVGVGFDAQFISDDVPRGPDDQRLDWMLTDRRACAFV